MNPLNLQLNTCGKVIYHIQKYIKHDPTYSNVLESGKQKNKNLQPKVTINFLMIQTEFPNFPCTKILSSH